MFVAESYLPAGGCLTGERGGCFAYAPSVSLMVHIDVASTAEHFEQIIDLQRRNHISALPLDVQNSEGFVFAMHTVPLLRRMSAELPQAIALANDRVVGYCLSLPQVLRDEVATLGPMFDHFERCSYHDRPLSSFRFFVGGQVCVDAAYRGRGILARLYEHVRQTVSGSYELCVTEVAVRNPLSIRAHERMGFEEISRYSDGSEDWVIVAWDLTRPAVLQ